MPADILRRSDAPITPEAWKLIDEEAQRVLRGHLSARKVVDFDGPHGWEKDSLNLGTLDVPADNKMGGVTWGLRQLQPLIEARAPFFLTHAELESISRGNQSPDLDPVTAAARALAIFEESAVYKGLKKAAVDGIEGASSREPLNMDLEAQSFDRAVSRGIETLQLDGVDGPYSLVLGTKPYQFLMAELLQGGLSLVKAVERKIRGAVLWSPGLHGGVLLSTRGGDCRLTVGQDISIGYAHHDREKIELYLVESFTFRVLEPRAQLVYTV